MFGIGPLELVFIFVVALLVFGPKKLPELARTLGKGLAEFRRASSDLRRSMDFEIDSKTFEDTSAPAQTGSPHIAPEPGSALDRLETERQGSRHSAETQVTQADEQADSGGGIDGHEAHPEYEPNIDVRIEVETETDPLPRDKEGVAPMPAPRAPDAGPSEDTKKDAEKNAGKAGGDVEGG
jgi:TatA/E family protein of Tat protein translocase